MDEVVSRQEVLKRGGFSPGNGGRRGLLCLKGRIWGAWGPSSSNVSDSEHFPASDDLTRRGRFIAGMSFSAADTVDKKWPGLSLSSCASTGIGLSGNDVHGLHEKEGAAVVLGLCSSLAIAVPRPHLRSLAKVRGWLSRARLWSWIGLRNTSTLMSKGSKPNVENVLSARNFRLAFGWAASILWDRLKLPFLVSVFELHFTHVTI